MINKAMLIGRIGHKSEKTTKNGHEMATLNIATNRKWIDSNGQSSEKTTWHTVNLFGKIADIAKKYASVGNLVYIEGEINHVQLEGGEHAGQWSYSITATQLKLLPSTKRRDEDAEEMRPTGNNNYHWVNPQDEITEDNIPF